MANATMSAFLPSCEISASVLGWSAMIVLQRVDEVSTPVEQRWQQRLDWREHAAEALVEIDRFAVMPLKLRHNRFPRVLFDGLARIIGHAPAQRYVVAQAARGVGKGRRVVR